MVAMPLLAYSALWTMVIGHLIKLCQSDLLPEEFKVRNEEKPSFSDWSWVTLRW